MTSKFIAVAAAIVASASAAGAADLNKPAKVAVDYVKVCDAYGAGFFYIPGSDTCLKISGFVYANQEYGVSNTIRAASGAGATAIGKQYGGPEAGQRSTNQYATYARGALSFDARTNTQYGLLRSMISYNVNVGSSATNSATTSVRLDAAYVQLGGLTAGRAPTMFGFYASDVFDFNYGQISDTVNVNLLAYTFSFGNGVTATISVEDPTTADNLNTAATNTSAAFRRNGFTFNYGGLNVPDVVANIDVLQAWGEARLGVAAHQVYGSTLSPATKWGFAVEGTVLVNVPQLGTGDKIGLTAAYAQGANGYVNGAGQINGVYAIGSGGLTDLGTDATWSAASGLKLTRSWSVFGGITHNFSPEFELDAAVGYENTTNGGSGVAGVASVPAGFAAPTNNNYTMGQTEFSAVLKWKPAKGIFIAPYVEFRNVGFSTATRNNYQLLTKNATAADFGLRVRRDF